MGLAKTWLKNKLRNGKAVNKKWDMENSKNIALEFTRNRRNLWIDFINGIGLVVL